MKIELKSAVLLLPVGCCYTTGYDVFVDGKEIGSIGEDAYELAELLNEYFTTKEK